MAKEPSLTDLARALGLSQLAAQRYAKATGGSSRFVSKVMSVLNHLVSGGSRRTMPASLPKEVIDALGQIGQGQAPPVKDRPVDVPPPFKSGSGRKPKEVWRQNEPPTQAEEEEWTDEFIAVFSSNVFSFRQHQKHGASTATFYVTFRAANLNHGAFTTGRVHRGSGLSRKQLVGGKGTHAGGERPLVAGPTYAYYNTPPSLFEAMKAAHSRGEFVWDNLRVRGSISGSRYSYGLVSGQVVPGLGVYVPRKSTRSGFRSRSLADVGTGRRGFITSTLAPSSNGTGFRTRSAPGKRGR